MKMNVYKQVLSIYQFASNLSRNLLDWNQDMPAQKVLAFNKDTGRVFAIVNEFLESFNTQKLEYRYCH